MSGGEGPVLAQLLQPHEWHVLRERRTLARGRTKIQTYRIVELENYGRALLLGECIQSTQADEGIYHQSLILPAVALHGAVRRVLCFGGANGGIAKVLARLPQVEHLVQVDVDETLAHVTRHYLPHMFPERPPAFAHELVFADPTAWLAERGDAYAGWADLVIADLPDATEDSYAPSLFKTSFYERIRAVLAPRGVLATGAGQLHPFAREFNARVLRRLRGHFPAVSCYGRFVPSYGVPWALALAGEESVLAAPAETVRARIERMGEFDFYDWPTHRHMFDLPKDARAAAAAGDASGDEPLYVQVAAQAPTV